MGPSAEIAPENIKGKIGTFPSPLSCLYSYSLSPLLGVLNQVSISTGILITQSIGLTTKHTSWRYVFIITTIISLLQILLSVFMPIDTPAWLAAQGRHTDAISTSHVLWNSKDSARGHDEEEEGEEGALLRPDPTSPSAPSAVPSTEPITIGKLLTKKELRRPVLVVAFVMLAQQGSGINAGLNLSPNP